jgi:hypothetical protein
MMLISIFMVIVNRLENVKQRWGTFTHGSIVISIK